MRTLRLFDPVDEFNVLRREIDRAFEAARGASPLRNAFLPGRSPRSYPQINVSEDADNVYVEALAPGLDPDKIEVTVIRNQMTISGEKEALAEKSASDKVHRAERAGGRFVRNFALPAEIDEARVTAEYRAGILRLVLPKAESAKPKKIAVTVG